MYTRYLIKTLVSGFEEKNILILHKKFNGVSLYHPINVKVCLGAGYFLGSMEVVHYIVKMCCETQHSDLCTEHKYDVRIIQEIIMKGILSVQKSWSKLLILFKMQTFFLLSSSFCKHSF